MFRVIADDSIREVSDQRMAARGAKRPFGKSAMFVKCRTLTSDTVAKPYVRVFARSIGRARNTGMAEPELQLSQSKCANRMQLQFGILCAK